jgi:hypothetical protein
MVCDAPDAWATLTTTGTTQQPASSRFERDGKMLSSIHGREHKFDGLPIGWIEHVNPGSYPAASS